LRNQGQRLACGCLVVNWQPLPEGQSRLGVITSSRIGGAVVRNRARRLLREGFRQHRSRLLQAVDLILVARPSIVGKTYSEVERDFLASLRKAGLLKRLNGT
jgi:ribonuclease P protein component